MHRAFVAACSIVLLVGCKSRSPAASVAPATEPESRSRGGAGFVDEARKIALAATIGHAPVDQRIADLSKVARLQPRRVETWILLGRAWVWKARETSDPGYYWNAKACADVALDLSPGNGLPRPATSRNRSSTPIRRSPWPGAT